MNLQNDGVPNVIADGEAVNRVMQRQIFGKSRRYLRNLHEDRPSVLQSETAHHRFQHSIDTDLLLDFLFQELHKDAIFIAAVLEREKTSLVPLK